LLKYQKRNEQKHSQNLISIHFRKFLNLFCMLMGSGAGGLLWFFFRNPSNWLKLFFEGEFFPIFPSPITTHGRIQGGGLGINPPPLFGKNFQFARVFKKKSQTILPWKISGYAPVTTPLIFWILKYPSISFRWNWVTYLTLISRPNRLIENNARRISESSSWMTY